MSSAASPFRIAALCAALATLAGAAMPASAAAAAAPAANCLVPGAWTRTGTSALQPVDTASVIAEQAAQDVVLLGEQHDSADHHRWQLYVLAALHARREAMVLGFEMFPRRMQGVLDRWVAGELSEARFLEEVQWDKVWSMPAELYMPLFHFARLNRVPMIALNVDQELIRRVAANGWDKVDAQEREGVGRAAPPLPAYEDFLFGIHREHVRMRAPAAHGKSAASASANAKAAPARRDDARFRNFVDSQLTWDRAMAEALARGVRQAPGPTEQGRAPLAVGILGSGHVRHGYGVAHQLRDLGISKVGLLLPVEANTPCAHLPPGIADAVFAVPAATLDPPPPPRLGVSLADGKDGVAIAEVAADSLAARSGLRAGDVVRTAGGVAMTRSAAFAAAVRAQAPGSWLPLQLRRGDEEIELIIKFPPHP